MFLCYIVNYLDRFNISFAALEMKADLGLSDAAYGVGAAMFFAGYVTFEIPSNLILARVGARRWMARIMITWGVLSCGMMLVRTPTTLYVVRFLLGLAEAGFLPGMIFYLTHWFPARERPESSPSSSPRPPSRAWSARRSRRRSCGSRERTGSPAGSGSSWSRGCRPWCWA